MRQATAHIRLMRPRGVAILMVLAILAGLMALAAPFVLSMILHGRSARADLHALQARAGADAATAKALAQLHKNTLRFNLEAGEPEITTLKDLKVPMEFPAAPKEFDKRQLNVQDPTGIMWSAKIEDEQAKINVGTCPPALLGNLMGSGLLSQPAEKGTTQLIVDDARRFAPTGMICMNGEPNSLHYVGIQGNVIVLSEGTFMHHGEGELVFDGRARQICDYKFKKGGNSFVPYRSVYEIKMALSAQDGLQPDEFARIERHLTVQSGLDGPRWGHAERTTAGTGLAGGFNVERGDGFTPGALIRVVDNGVPTNFERVRRAVLRNDGGAYIELDNPISLPEKSSNVNDFYIEPEIRHPININTASPEVLTAVFTGLCTQQSKDAIPYAKAQELAYDILANGATYIDEIGLKKALDAAHTKGILTAPERDAAFINATEPGSPKLKTSTVPFVYFSFGSYTIEGTGVVNSDNGIQYARNTTRQLVTLPTPWPGRFHVEYQAGFENLLDQGLGKRVVTFPIPMGTEKFKKNAAIKLPSFTSGGVRLDVGESGPHRLPNEFLDHCIDEKDPGYRQDGYDMAKRGPFTIPLVGNNGGVPQGGNLPRGANGNPTIMLGARNNQNNQQQYQNANLPPRQNQTASQPTAVELWYRPIRPSQCVFYDESLEEDRNRVTLSYEPSAQPKPGVVLKIYDAGLECQDAQTNGWNHLKRPPVECIFPITFDGGEWYHVASSWKNGRMNGQDIRIDAQPEPHNEKLIFRPGARLSGGLGLDDDQSLEVETEDGKLDELFPKNGGAIQIGEEIIEYLKRNGSSFTQLRRGARTSAQAKHEGGEFVMPYGYSNPLGYDLPVGGATVSERIEKPSVQRNCRIEMPPTSKIPFVLDSELQKIPVNDCSDFPPSGFITVGGELIYYAKRTATAFLTLQRAQRSGNTGAPARNLGNGSGVQLASIEITDTAQYDAPGIVQIDDDSNDKIVEWIAYADRQAMNGHHYLTANLASGGQYIQVGNPPVQKNGNSIGVSDFRNKFGIPTQTLAQRESSHDKKAKVIPVTRMNGPHCGDQLSPYGEDGVSEVSVIERGTTNADLRYVKQAYNNQYANWHYTGPNGSCPAVFDSWGLEYYVGLNDFVSRRYPGNTSRMLKWPSGELPDAVGAKRIVGADRNGEGKLHGHVDEVKVNTFDTLAARIAMTTQATGIQASDEEILVENADAWPSNGNGGSANLNWPTTGGLVRIEDELIFYKALGQGGFQYYADTWPHLDNKPPEQNKADRRWVNPCTKDHELHLNIKNKTGTRLTGVIRGVLGTKAADHPVGAQVMLLDGMGVSLLRGSLFHGADTFTIADPQARGFPDEGYAWIENEVVSYMKLQGSTFTGCRYFRGCFGTAEGEHEQDAIVRVLPFRYWDREGKQYDGDGLAYIQAGYAASDAIWDSIDMKITGTDEIPAAPARVRPRVLIRFDGNPLWSTEPVNREGGLYEYRFKEGKTFIKGAKGGVQAEQLEMRVYWQYLKGAFIPNNDWKRTFTIEKMRATYHTPLIMRRLDEVERR